MPIDLTKLSKGIGALSPSLILVSPQTKEGMRPQDSSGGAGAPILFDYEVENTATISSDITDHFVEDNTSISDHISIKPEIITVSGVIGELNQLITQNPVLSRTAIDKLTVVSAYQPELTLTALRAYNTAEQAYRLAQNAISDTLAAFNGAFGETVSQEIASGQITAGQEKAQNNQQIFFAKFYGYWRNRTLFNVQTPWAIFKNMAIQDMKAIQGEETDTMTDFSITFKSIRFARSAFLGSEPVVEGRGNDAASQVNNVGDTTGQPSTINPRSVYDPSSVA